MVAIIECPHSLCFYTTPSLDDFIDHVKGHGVKTPGIEKINGTYKVTAKVWRN